MASARNPTVTVLSRERARRGDRPPAGSRDSQTEDDMRFLMASTVALVVGLVAWVNPYFAQEPATAAHVSGVVVDALGATLAGATVELLRGRQIVRSATTNTRGEFEFTNVPQGSYRLRSQLSGFLSVTQSVTVGRGGVEALRV